MPAQSPLRYEYDEATDVMIIEGVRYSGALLRGWGRDGFPVGMCIRIKSRDDGVLTVETIRGAS